LEILDRDDLLGRCKEMGDYMSAKLNEVRRAYPEQIEEIRGKGLMLGIQLHEVPDSSSNGLRLVSENGHLGTLCATYLLNRHAIRVAPTLSQPSTLRIEPSAYITHSEVNWLISGLSRLCDALKASDTVYLTGHLVGKRSKRIVDYSTYRSPQREEPETDRRVAFIGHFIEPKHLKLWDPSFEFLPDGLIEKLIEKSSEFFGTPTINERINVRSITGEMVHLSFIGLYVTSMQIERAMRARDLKWLSDQIEAAVALARDDGCQVVGLGGYASILTGNCRKVSTTGILLTSGNSLTVGAGVVALKSAAEERGIELRETKLGVVGANGNIAGAYAAMLSSQVSELVLIVRDRTVALRSNTVKGIRAAHPDLPVHLHEGLDALRDCSLIVSASNSSRPLIYPRHLSNRPIVICDISVPTDVSDEVRHQLPQTLVIQGGIVQLPHNQDFAIGGIPLEGGHVFSCMAETMLMGLERVRSHGSYGQITMAGIENALSMARRHGFKLGQFKTDRSF